MSQMFDIGAEVSRELYRMIRRDRRVARGLMLLALIALVLVAWSVISCAMRPLLSVQGTVTLRGERLPRGVITFHAKDDEPPLAGAVIANGEYRISAGQGLQPGTYLVRIHATAVKGGTTSSVATPPADELIPSAFSTASKQFREVSRLGRNRFDFHIP